METSISQIINNILDTQRDRARKEELVLQSFKDLEPNQRLAVFVRIYEHISQQEREKPALALPKQAAPVSEPLVSPRKTPRTSLKDSALRLLKKNPGGLSVIQVACLNDQTKHSAQATLRYLSEFGLAYKGERDLWYPSTGSPSKARVRQKAMSKLSLRALVEGVVTNSPTPLTAKEICEVINKTQPTIAAFTVRSELSRAVGRKTLTMIRARGPGGPLSYSKAAV